jgi:hypothetical protein
MNFTEISSILQEKHRKQEIIPRLKTLRLTPTMADSSQQAKLSYALHRANVRSVHFFVSSTENRYLWWVHRSSIDDLRKEMAGG